MELKSFDYKRAAAIFICLFGALAVIYIGFRFLLPVAVPFLLAWGVALCLRPLNAWLHKKTGIPLRALSLITVLLGLLLFLSLISYLVFRLVNEIRGFAAALAENPDALSGLLRFLEPLLRGNEGVGNEGLSLFEELKKYLEVLLANGVGELLSGIPLWLGNAVLSLPAGLLFLFVTVIAACYFSMDLSRIHKTVRGILPSNLCIKLSEWREKTFRTGALYVRAYLILTAVIAVILLFGFLILGVDYALLLSLLFALLDFLPVIGVGTLLVPWCLISFATGNLFLGIGLLVLFAVIEITRQIIEPRLVGDSLGVSPLLSLFSLYAGAKLFGLIGILLGPLAAVFLKSTLSPLLSAKNKKPVA